MGISNSYKWKNVPVWFLCGSADNTVGVNNVATNYKNLVTAGAPVPPKMTLYTGVGHDTNSVNKSYAPSLMDNELETAYQEIVLDKYSNIYNWLLSFHR